MPRNPLDAGELIGDHAVITCASRIEAVVVPLEEYQALRALEQREAEMYWAVHEIRNPSRTGDEASEGQRYESMDELMADLDFPE